jgi:hypothetical protein
VSELGERGLVVDDRSVWEFVHAEKLNPVQFERFGLGVGFPIYRV